MAFGKRKKQATKTIPKIKELPQVKEIGSEDSTGVEAAQAAKDSENVKLVEVTSEQMINIKLNTIIERLERQSKIIDILVQKIELIEKLAQEE